MKRLMKLPLLAVAACLVSCEALAIECVFKGVDADARVVHESGAMFQPDTWTTHAQCERLRVASGEVRTIYRAVDGRYIKHTVSHGKLIGRGEAASDPVLGEIGLMLSGDERVRAGRSRGSSASFDSVERALPRGQVVQPDGALEIAIPVVADEIGADFRLSQGNHAIYRGKLVRQAVVIPAGVLVAGKSYDWSVNSKQNAANGTFSVVTAGTYAAALQAMPPMATDPATDPAGYKLEKASALLNAGYALEARKLLREVISE